MTILLLPGSVTASEEKDVTEIPWGDSVYVRINNPDGNMDITYKVTVTEGANVNVWFVPQKGKDQYYDDTATTYQYYPEYSVQDTRSASKDFRMTDSGTFYVIIDVTDMSAIGENATVDYKITWEPMSVGDWMVNIGICLAIVIVILIVGFFIRKARRKVVDQPVPPPMEQQPGMEYQQQQAYDQPPPRPSGLPPSDQGPGYVPPEPSTPPQEPGAYDPTQKPPEY
ncbi:MAG: hypothetical protein JSW25_03295 [Thermoplasmata archaeon]|nr:MAG: hypothetical protein JSW25_03295 [Thermoplasmata archaeon]